MKRICENCKNPLPEGASFCPHCATVKVDKKETKKPILWRKKLFLVGIGLILMVSILALRS